MSFEVPVPCPCPGTPHPDGDTINLREKLGLHDGIAIQRLIINANTATDRLGQAELEGILAEGYLLYGVESWTLVGEGGGLIPCTKDTIRSVLLADFTLAAPVAEAADKLYMAAVILPLVTKGPRSSPTTPTGGSTYQRPDGTHKSRKRSRPSSTTTTPTESTAMTSSPLAGASSS